jgi:nitrate/nitrite transport system substrate-binding protein
MRGDIYAEAMKEIGFAHGGENNEPEMFFDGGKFDPKGDLEAYAKNFAIHGLKA